MKNILSTLFIVSLFVFFTGCSSKQNNNLNTNTSKTYENAEDAELADFDDEFSQEEKSDPLSGYNRVMTDFNDGVYTYVLSPVAKGYRKITHKEVRNSVQNFFHNILFPVRFVNNLLQGKFKNTAEETGRFIINSTIGVLGLFDPAKSHFDLEPHNEDFGQTLGYWGVGSGPHIVLPFFGPSNLRDTISMYPDALANPVVYNDDREYNLVSNDLESLGATALDKVNEEAIQNGIYEKIRQDAVDLYPYLRDMYEQRREQLIKE